MGRKNILGITIEEIGLSSSLHTARAVQWIYSLLMPEDPIKDRKALIELASIISIADLINAWDKSKSPHLIWSDPSMNMPRWFKEIRNKLISMGLTRLEWVALPVQTLSPKKLKSLGKEALLQKSVLMLGTISVSTLNAMADQFGKLPHLITIGDILPLTEYEWGYKTDYAMSAFLTCRKLSKIGFGFEDGRFMQFGTRRLFVNDLIEKERISKKQARMVADIAYRQCWIKRTLRWNLFR